MTGRLLYLIGEPGVGKTATMAALTGGLNRLGVLDEPQPARTVFADSRGLTAAIELGRRRRGGFSGTDALAMSVIGAAEAYLLSGRAAAETSVLLAEGARLANSRFLRAAVAAGWTVHLAHLANSGIAAGRRAGRGSTQNAAWVRGAATRATNLAAAAPAGVHVHTVDPSGTPHDVADRITAWFQPAVAAALRP